MKIHISESTKCILKYNFYEIIERGTLEIKGKGTMKTYFVEAKLDEKGDPIKPIFSETIVEDLRLKLDSKHDGFKIISIQQNNEGALQNKSCCETNTQNKIEKIIMSENITINEKFYNEKNNLEVIHKNEKSKFEDFENMNSASNQVFKNQVKESFKISENEKTENSLLKTTTCLIL